MAAESRELAIASADGHRCTLLACLPAHPSRSLLWLPALGVAARHYLPFAQALAQRGVAVFVHEWRGHGSSSVRAGRGSDWGYRELLTLDLPASEAAMAAAAPSLPRVIGGHSLGGQLACCRLGLAPESAQALWLVASGSPYWRVFPRPLRWGLAVAYRALPPIARACGALPGRSLGFGGNEARSLIRDWARTGVRGRYSAAGIECDLEAALRSLAVPVRSVLLADDWMAPERSLRYLLDKMAANEISIARLDAPALGAGADHFAWMRQPERVAEALARRIATPEHV